MNETFVRESLLQERVDSKIRCNVCERKPTAFRSVVYACCAGKVMGKFAGLARISGR
jgi:hypothetical protein